MKTSHDLFDEMFEEVYRANYSFIVKYLCLIVNDFNIAEDLTHDLFLKIFKSRNAVITGGQSRNYLKMAAKNIAVDYLRKQVREDAKTRKIISEIKEYDEAFYQSLENSIIDGEVISTVQDVLENFSESSRMIFISRVFEKKTRKQVSRERCLSSYCIKRIEIEILDSLRCRLKNFLDG